MKTRTHRDRTADRGTVTAETALVLPVVVLLLALVLATGQVTAAQMDCVDASRCAARLAARGEPRDRTVAAARSLAPPGADVTVRTLGDQVQVTVAAVVALPLPGRPNVAVRAVSRSHLERSWEAAAERTGTLVQAARTGPGGSRPDPASPSARGSSPTPGRTA